MDLVSARFGGTVVSCNDEFFAPVANLIKPDPPLWREGEFTEHGKWMDGWETRRRRDEGHDSCVIRLGLPGRVRSVTVDTSYFTGNYPERFSLDASGDPTADNAEWTELIPPTALKGDSVDTFEVDDPHRVTLLRLNIYPDGGVARLRVEGDPIPAMPQVCPDSGPVDLAVATVGGRGTEASDAHFSSPANLVSPVQPEGMWDGWETRRRRGPGHDWAVVELGLPGTIESIDVDTRHFKGNSPGWVSLDIGTESGWQEACERVAVEADTVNHVELPAPVTAERVRLNIHPDGGVARLRVWGTPDPKAAAAVGMRYLNALYPGPAASVFRTACASSRWVKVMAAGRPYWSGEALLEASDLIFDRLRREDWLEAFAAHPRIGETTGRQSHEGEAMSAREQSGVSGADAELAEANRRYEERFGYTYIVRAAGRDADELLALANQRLGHDPDSELEVASEQQRQITELRLRRMLCIGD